MAILQADMMLKTAIELGIEDMRKNPWLIDEMLGQCVSNIYLKSKYGENQVKACKEWFENNQIDIYMRFRKDKDRLPCVIITLGSSEEKPEMKTMGDRSTDTMFLYPNQIGKPIPYVVKPFVPVSYDPSTQILEIPAASLTGPSPAVGMVLVNPANGNGFPILAFTGTGVQVAIDQKNISTATVFGIVPQFQYYKARVEHTFFRETYNIECVAHGDPNTLLWLHSIVLYSLLRYRESLLEANGFAETIVSSSDLFPTESYLGPAGEEAFSRVITLTAQIENAWVKSPQRFIEDVQLKEKTSDGFIGGISIIANTDPTTTEEKANVVWYTDTEQEIEDSQS